MNFFHALVLASMAAVAAGLVAQRLFRNAATRHAILLAALLLPPVLLIAAVAGVRLPAASVATTDVIVDAVEPAAAGPSREVRLPAPAIAVWLIGFATSLVRIAIHLLRWRGVASRAELVNGRVRSSEVRKPTVIGIVHPLIVLPVAYDFTAAELAAVFAHERAHVARRDNLAALLVQLVCAAFWFDPLHHVARRKLVELRERAVDDVVLDHGCDAEAYVGALARSCETSIHAPAVACMSRLNLEERMESIMSHQARRRWPVSITRGFIAVAVSVVSIAFATFAPAPLLTAGETPVGVPDFDIRATPLAGGRYTVHVRVDIPDAQFTSVAEMASAPDTRTISTTHGGKTYEVVVNLESDGAVRGSLMIREGETIVAATSKWFGRQEPAANENITKPRPIHRVNPRYPEEAKVHRIAGVVIIETSIDEQGNVTGARVLKPLPFGLDQAALDAVRQWKFEPALLDGKPVATKLNITINFLPE